MRLTSLGAFHIRFHSKGVFNDRHAVGVFTSLCKGTLGGTNGHEPLSVFPAPTDACPGVTELIQNDVHDSEKRT